MRLSISFLSNQCSVQSADAMEDLEVGVVVEDKLVKTMAASASFMVKASDD